MEDAIADELNGGIESSIRTRMKMRNRQRKEHANFKRAKKYVSPSEELTRLQIREDIRKMRNPKMENIEEILKMIGFTQFVNHEKYLPESNLMNRPRPNQYREEDNVIDDDVQFVGITKHKKKRKRKRKHRHHADYHLAKPDEVSPSNSVLSMVSNEQNGESLPRNVINIGDFDDGAEPQRKKAKPSGDEVLKCHRCNKVFTLEVDLLIHKVNDKHE